MLKFMVFLPFGMFGETQNPTGFHIFIMFVDVGVGMVQNIVLYLPIIDISRKNVYTAAHNFVHPFFVGVGTMVSIVHNVHTNTRHAYAHDYGK